MDVVSLGFRTDLAVLELAGSQVERHADHIVVRTPSTPTFWWGNCMVLREVPPSEETATWLDRCARAFPSATHVAIGVDATHGTVQDLDGFAESGLEVEASTVMTARSVDEPRRRNAAAELRPLVTDEDWLQSVELSLRCHGPDEDEDLDEVPEQDPGGQRTFFEARARTNRGLVQAGHGRWFGAYVQDRLVSQLGLLTPVRGVARFQSVETDPEFRRRGLAGTLVHGAGRWGLGEAGAEVLLIVADPDYFAVDLYRALGFEASETQLQVQGSRVCQAAGIRGTSPC